MQSSLPPDAERLPRQVVEEHSFTRDWTSLFADAGRAAEALEGLQKVLETLAHYGQAVPGVDGLYGFPINLDGDLFRVFYRFTDEQIFLEGVCPLEEPR